MTDPRNELFLGWLRERDAQVSRMLEPWIAVGFDCVQLIHSMGAESHRMAPDSHAGLGGSIPQGSSVKSRPALNPLTSSLPQRGERGPESPRSTLPPALAISFDRSAQWPES